MINKKKISYMIYESSEGKYAALWGKNKEHRNFLKVKYGDPKPGGYWIVSVNAAKDLWHDIDEIEAEDSPYETISVTVNKKCLRCKERFVRLHKNNFICPSCSKTNSKSDTVFLSETMETVHYK